VLTNAFYPVKIEIKKEEVLAKEFVTIT